MCVKNEQPTPFPCVERAFILLAMAGHGLSMSLWPGFLRLVSNGYSLVFLPFHHHPPHPNPQWIGFLTLCFLYALHHKVFRLVILLIVVVMVVNQRIMVVMENIAFVMIVVENIMVEYFLDLGNFGSRTAVGVDDTQVVDKLDRVLFAFHTEDMVARKNLSFVTMGQTDSIGSEKTGIVADYC
nr:hypothetical protein [Tanacetum cinerariifolium]